MIIRKITNFLNVYNNKEEFGRLRNDMHCYREFAYAFNLKVKAAHITRRTVAAVICKQKLEYISAVFSQPFCIRFYLHSRLWNSRTCRIKAAPLVFNHTHAACAVYGEL